MRLMNNNTRIVVVVLLYVLVVLTVLTQNIGASAAFGLSTGSSISPITTTTLTKKTTSSRRQRQVHLLLSNNIQPRLFASSVHHDDDDVPTKTTTTTTTTEDSTITTITNNNKETRFRTLKDMMWIRECLEDLTSAEFASSLDDDYGISAANDGDVMTKTTTLKNNNNKKKNDEDSSSSGKRRKNKKKKKRAVDYEKLLNQLNRRIADLGVTINDGGGGDDTTLLLESGKGMGWIIYTEDERQDLLKRILKTKRTLEETMKTHARMIDDDDEDDDDDRQQPSFGMIRLPDLPEITIPKEEEEEEEDSSSSSSSRRTGGPKLYVRDDGTVDWDGALQDRAALQQFGTAVWARINGRDPSSVLAEDSVQQTTKQQQQQTEKEVTVKIEETEEIRRQRSRLEKLKDELNEMEVQHTALLKTAISADQAVANINLATLGPRLRAKIRESTSELEKKKEEVSYQLMNFELERIYTYLAGELLGTPMGTAKGYIPLQDRLNVAEFGLLESQIETFNQQLEKGEFVDADVLAVVLEQVTDFKRRLGIDYFVAGFTFDREAIQRWLADLIEKTKKGVAFYVKGCVLFWNDIVFALSLIGRALQGYTLKPREVRNLRRTFKDIITFIPVVIILLIPLSPVGHVLVFGAIQRFFPDFFPSCFTESRQNLLELYEGTEYSEVSINETWREKLARVGKATGFAIMNLGRNAVEKVAESINEDQQRDSSKPNGEEDR